jgi:glycosyltransferase involved in cell wall biosynthesis
MNDHRIAVVIPCFRVRDKVEGVIQAIPSIVDVIYAVDDACPEKTADYLENHCQDERVVIIRHQTNQGVGGAVTSGYLRALQDNVDVVVKLDGDGQMDPELLPRFIEPIITGRADYTKGNRFFSLERVRTMPFVRLAGNAVLSFVNKAVSGYWGVMDPTNGYTAIHCSLLPELAPEKLEKRYFFESDMLYRLSLARAVVVDIPMHAKYSDEKSSLSIVNTLWRFPPKYISRFFKRFFYNYILRDFNAGSMESLLGLPLLLLGGWFGLTQWLDGIATGVPASAGTVMLAALPIILGMQLLLSALQYDIANQPWQPVHSSLAG